MDKNTVVGFALIFLVLIGWQYMMAPSAEELQEQKRVQDSIAQVEQAELAKTKEKLAEEQINPIQQLPDSLADQRLAFEYGAFAPAAKGSKEIVSIENDKIKLDISTKGGYIVEAHLKDYLKVAEGENNTEIKSPLSLLEDEKNKFEYILPVGQAAGGIVKTSDLYFQPTVSGNTVTLKAPVANGGYLEQTYTLSDDGYDVDYNVNFNNLNQVIRGDVDKIKLNWVNYLSKLEKNVDYERNYSTSYYKPTNDDVDNCSCTGDDDEDVDDEKVKWVTGSNQFFNSTLIADNAFKSANLKVEVLDPEDEDLKKLQTEVYIPYGEAPNVGMTWYIGPNDYLGMVAVDEKLGGDLGLKYIVPFGSGIFATINRYVVRPIFNFLSKYIGSAGIVILILTLIIKMAMYPFMYKMLHSQSKMAALKPRLAKLGEKFKDDAQAKQMETMKIYREYGVNPLGGCLPMVFQMPVWIALYRFFPGSIEFRQKSFLWATDLSSYDVAFNLPFEIPFYGDHVSAFTLLWALATIAYTYYNTKHMDMSSMNPAMKYMQYFMPLMFLFFFNSFAAGLTVYLFFSSLFNIIQTLVTKNYIIDQDKILNQLEVAKAAPKKKGGFGARIEAALKEQQKLAEQQAKKGRKK